MGPGLIGSGARIRTTRPSSGLVPRRQFARGANPVSCGRYRNRWSTATGLRCRCRCQCRWRYRCRCRCRGRGRHHAIMLQLLLLSHSVHYLAARCFSWILALGIVVAGMFLIRSLIRSSAVSLFHPSLQLPRTAHGVRCAAPHGSGTARASGRGRHARRSARSGAGDRGIRLRLAASDGDVGWRVCSASPYRRRR